VLGVEFIEHDEACDWLPLQAWAIMDFFNLCGSLGFSFMISKVIKLIQLNLNFTYFANVSLHNEALK